jgi:hypothetical protein
MEITTRPKESFLFKFSSQMLLSEPSKMATVLGQGGELEELVEVGRECRNNRPLW